MTSTTADPREAKHEVNPKLVQSLATYSLLGRSGLRVAPICLGTANFGDQWGEGWTMSKGDAAKIVNRYIEAGGNFIDTADCYNNGQSEEILGAILRDGKNRDRVVVATKFTFGMHSGDPNGGGNGRKHLMEAVDASLRRLGTDYIDLYWMHNWDTMTPAEEMMSTLNALVVAGKVRYIGLSNPPGWFLGRAQTIAELRGWEKICAIQMQYSLAVRNIEFEYTDACLQMGIGIVPWSPLASGLLTGKYSIENGKVVGDGRVTNSWIPDGTVDIASPRMDALLKELKTVAKELGKPASQVALNWLTNRPAVASSIIGATRMSQLEDNIAALEFEIPREMVARLNEASMPVRLYPYNYHEGDYQKMVNCETTVRYARS